MQEVEQLCDRVIIINKGEIVADKPIGELKLLSATKTVVVEFDKTCSASQLKKIDNVQKVTVLGEKRFEIATSDSKRTRQSLFQFAVASKLSIVEVSEQSQNLESIFHRLTQ
jgi:ABC-2 type transport system ATP-binding protein